MHKHMQWVGDAVVLSQAHESHARSPWRLILAQGPPIVSSTDLSLQTVTVSGACHASHAHASRDPELGDEMQRWCRGVWERYVFVYVVLLEEERKIVAPTSLGFLLFIPSATPLTHQRGRTGAHRSG